MIKSFLTKDEFSTKKDLFQNAKWGSYLILPLHDNPKGKLKMSRQEAIDIILKKQDESGKNVFAYENIDASDLSDILTSRCKNRNDFVDQYHISCKLKQICFSEKNDSKEKYVEVKDIHLYYFPESELALLTILLVNQDFSVDNFYELINPGYMLDYDKVQGLKENFAWR